MCACFIKSITIFTLFGFVTIFITNSLSVSLSRSKVTIFHLQTLELLFKSSSPLPLSFIFVYGKLSDELLKSRNSSPKVSHTPPINLLSFPSNEEISLKSLRTLCLLHRNRYTKICTIYQWQRMKDSGIVDISDQRSTSPYF